MNSHVRHEGQQVSQLLRRFKHPLEILLKTQPATSWRRRGHASAAAAKSRIESIEQEQDNTFLKRPLGGQALQKEADREFFANLLSSAATRRDAKPYLNRLANPTKTKPVPTRQHLLEKGSYVNLGNLFPGSRAAEQSPTFSQSEPVEGEYAEPEQLHVALVKITDVRTLSSAVLYGIAETLAQLNRLSISPCVVLDESQPVPRAVLAEVANKLVSAIEEIGHGAAREVNNVFSITTSGQTIVSHKQNLMRSLRKGQIPIVNAIAYDEKEQKMAVIPAVDALLALTEEFTEVSLGESRKDEALARSEQRRAMQKKEVSVDRLIIVDSVGGVPNEAAADGRHVFLNLEQEYGIVKDRLQARSEQETAQSQLTNLNLLYRALQLLPPTSSGLMVTYEEAANLKSISEESSVSEVGTRRQKNTLIHNILTDKPAYSSSLPIGRLTQKDHTGAAHTNVSRSSFVKRGMPLNILPNPFKEPWVATSSRMRLTDPRIDLDKLVFLIEDSFGRKLDVEDYLKRVNDRIAGVIIAGDYEGGAILTWETPDDDPDAEPVPYLDKFAVLRRSQGAGGVADIVFNAMVRSCFPNGVCWRSRGGNPVNKWYMERSTGTWKLSKAWTMFWTTPGVEMDTAKFRTYAAVCRGVQPSWADRQKPAD